MKRLIEIKRNIATNTDSDIPTGIVGDDITSRRSLAFSFCQIREPEGSSQDVSALESGQSYWPESFFDANKDYIERICLSEFQSSI